MDDRFVEDALKRLEDNLSSDKERHSYRECLLTAIVAKNFTLKTAELIVESNMLRCTVYDMDFSIALRNHIHFWDILLFNDEDNLRFVIENLDSDEPFTLINNEVKNTLIASKELVEEIKLLMKDNKIKDENASIIELFDENTRDTVDALLKESFSCYLFIFTGDLLFTRKEDNSQFKYNVEMASLRFESETGLSRRPYIPDGAGMFYEFDSSGTHGFVTSNVVRDLSVAYIDATGIITEIVERKADDRNPYYNEIPCKGILEMTKGWFIENNIRVGDTIKLKTIIARD